MNGILYPLPCVKLNMECAGGYLIVIRPTYIKRIYFLYNQEPQANISKKKFDFYDNNCELSPHIVNCLLFGFYPTKPQSQKLLKAFAIISMW